MTMKLNDKGAKRIDIETMEYDPQDHVFESDDFEDAVVLTVEEAKALLRRIPEFKESGDWQLPIERLKERIAKAEMKDAND